MIDTDTLRLTRLNLLSQKALAMSTSAQGLRTVISNFAPAFKYLEQLEKEAADRLSGKVTDDFISQEEKPARVAENGSPLPDWAIGTAIDADGTIAAFAETPEFKDRSGEWCTNHAFANLGRVDLAGRDPATTWKEYK